MAEAWYPRPRQNGPFLTTHLVSQPRGCLGGGFGAARGPCSRLVALFLIR